MNKEKRNLKTLWNSMTQEINDIFKKCIAISSKAGSVSLNNMRF